MPTATIAGPLDFSQINLTIENTGGADIVSFGISGRTAKFPITWDNFGTFSGPATLDSTVGVDTEVVIHEFSNFGPGDSVSFNVIDADFTGAPSSAVRVGDIAGSQAMMKLSDGTTLFGEFRPNGSGSLHVVGRID